MKNRIVLSVIVPGLLVVLSAALAFAGSTASLNVTVPFAFTVGDVSFPSGDYRISETSMPGVLLIQSNRESLANYILTHAGRTSRDGDAKILFKRYGERYFLSQVSYGIDGDSRELSVSRLERELIGAARSTAHNAGQPAEVLVARTR